MTFTGLDPCLACNWEAVHGGIKWKTLGMGAAKTVSGGTVFPYNAYKIWKTYKLLNKLKREHNQCKNSILKKEILSNSDQGVDVNSW